MKELSIEEKAKAYDEALKVLHKYDGANIMFSQSLKEEMFPELKESEDERIRKWCISHFKECINVIKDNDEYKEYLSNKVIAWLEKQGEHANFCSKIQIGDKVTRNEDGVLVNLSQLKRVAKKDEKQGEQKVPDIAVVHKELNEHLKPQGEQKPADKVKPKFKVRDWITNGIDVYKIKNIDLNEFNYIFENGISDILLVDNICHLWTIQDAKDGDMLYTSSTASHETFIFKSIDEKGNAKCYFAYDSEDGFRDGKYHFIGRATDCKPATKEQRNLLFQKMAEAGYEWDTEKKELKKIEQKPAWSEEDENLRIRTIGALETCKIGSPTKCVDEQINWLKSLKDRVQPQPKQEWSEEDERMKNQLVDFILSGIDISKAPYGCVAWLKSISSKSTWKPSEEQMEALESATENCAYSEYQDCLRELIKQLKKLREE